MFYYAFDALLPENLREVNHPGGGYLPDQFRKEIDEMNDWVYNTVNNGVYKCGFAQTQEAYVEAVKPLFESLDRLEKHLEENGAKYLFGDHITEADIRSVRFSITKQYRGKKSNIDLEDYRLYPTLIRFDMAYVTIFRTNYKQIRYDYPRLHKWLRCLYWEHNEETRGAFNKTTNLGSVCFLNSSKSDHTANLTQIKEGYSLAMQNKIVPYGPKDNILPLDA